MAAVVDLGEEPDDERIVAPVAVVVVTRLVAGEDVTLAGFFGRIWLGFKQLFGMA